MNVGGNTAAAFSAESYSPKASHFFIERYQGPDTENYSRGVLPFG
jgi:hypothetical protein